MLFGCIYSIFSILFSIDLNSEKTDENVIAPVINETANSNVENNETDSIETDNQRPNLITTQADVHQCKEKFL